MAKLLHTYLGIPWYLCALQDRLDQETQQTVSRSLQVTTICIAAFCFDEEPAQVIPENLQFSGGANLQWSSICRQTGIRSPASSMPAGAQTSGTCREPLSVRIVVPLHRRGACWSPGSNNRVPAGCTQMQQSASGSPVQRNTLKATMRSSVNVNRGTELPRCARPCLPSPCHFDLQTRMARRLIHSRRAPPTAI